MLYAQIKTKQSLFKKHDSIFDTNISGDYVLYTSPEVQLSESGNVIFSAKCDYFYHLQTVKVKSNLLQNNKEFSLLGGNKLTIKQVKLFSESWDIHYRNKLIGVYRCKVSLFPWVVKHEVTLTRGDKLYNDLLLFSLLYMFEQDVNSTGI